MANQIVMDHKGDTRHYFNANDAKAVIKAEQRFKKLTGRGFTAAVRTGSGEAAVTRTIRSECRRDIVIPRLVAG
jgi:hypothetical protein